MRACRTHTRQPVSFLSTWPTTIFWIIREGTILVIVFWPLNEGANIAIAISEAPTEDRAGFQNVPTHDIVIETVELLSVEKGQEP